MGRKRSTPIPGLSFSWQRAVGVTKLRQRVSRRTGIPTSKSGLNQKVGRGILKKLFGR
ncbi:hypothetical protein [Porphyromonas sp.]|uniref:hypothetical protein n=1 Tax=Porphyromonas sp. TaxID=1924944 RepID=UPI003993699E